jgi:hypothetical protein
LRNTVCWLCSALLAVCLFSGCYASPRNTASIAFVFRTTLLFAFPVACVYLPFVLRLSRTGQLFLLTMGAALIGPASLGLLGVVRRVADTSYATDNGVSPGFGAVLVFALLIGTLAGMAYVFAFKMMLGRLTLVKSVHPHSDRRRPDSGNL